MKSRGRAGCNPSLQWVGSANREVSGVQPQAAGATRANQHFVTRRSDIGHGWGAAPGSRLVEREHSYSRLCLLLEGLP